MFAREGCIYQQSSVESNYPGAALSPSASPESGTYDSESQPAMRHLTPQVHIDAPQRRYATNPPLPHLPPLPVHPPSSTRADRHPSEIDGDSYPRPAATPTQSSLPTGIG